MKNIVKFAMAALMAANVQETAAIEASGSKGRGTYFIVPIDEKAAMKIKVSPDYELDTVQSVTLKAFRKIVGYDTFDSIRKKNRDEKRDSNDYYNVTVSMLVRRRPADLAPAPPRDVYNPDGGASLASTFDKGFPYDD